MTSGALLGGVTAPARPPIPPSPSQIPTAIAPLVPGIPMTGTVPIQPIAPVQPVAPIKLVSPPSGGGTPNLLSPLGSTPPPMASSAPLVGGIPPVSSVLPGVSQPPIMGIGQPMMGIASSVPMGVVSSAPTAPLVGGLTSIATPPSSATSLVTSQPVSAIPPPIPQPPSSGIVITI